MESQSAIPETPRWIRDIAHPVMVGVMMACVALGVARLAQEVFTEWSPTVFVMLPFIAALVGHYSYHAAHQQYISGVELWRYRAIELIIMFLIIKLITYADTGMAVIWADMQRWAHEPWTFFDLETLATWGMTVFAWVEAQATANDMAAIQDPTLYIGETPPMERLISRFGTGAAVLLVLTGLARVDVATLMHQRPPRAPGLILHILVYFVVGLVLIGQLRYTGLQAGWRKQNYTILENLRARWGQYSLLLLGVALLIAFVLPTDYTIGLLDIAGYVIAIIIYIIGLIFFAVSSLFAWLFFLFYPRGQTDTTPPVEPPPVPQTSTTLPTDTALPPWVLLLRSLVFWGLVLWGLWQLARHYLNDHPDLLPTLRQIKAVGVLRGVWQTLTAWWRAFWRVLSAQAGEVSRQVRRRLRPHAPVDPASARRMSGRSQRERVFRHYLDTLEAAREAGWPRRPAQTPYEYRETVTPAFIETAAEMENLTQTFVAARYSTDPITPEQVKAVRAATKRLQAWLREQREAAQAAQEESSGG